MAQPGHLLVQTTAGPILGYQDTYPLSDRSTAPLVASGEQGDERPINKWLGIPYAQAARWKRPTPPTSWTELLACHEFGPYFPQPQDPTLAIFLGKPGLFPRSWREQSEEKGFNLNVFQSDGIRPNDKVPVLVWIHGGGLTYGSACLSLYDPTDWLRREAAEGRKFIVVTGNYRLNVLGFLASSELAAEDEDGLAGNYGAYDCIAYLQWVQENIAKFGGDPDNVTACGESAGGAIISNLLLCQKKLFKNAILQSGFPGTLRFRNRQQIDATYEALCAKTVKDVPPTERLAALKALPVNDLLEHLPQAYVELSFTVESSPKAIWSSATVAKTLEQGTWNKHVKSVLLGINKDEGALFVLLFQSHTPAGYEFVCSVMFPEVPREDIDRLYPVSFPTEALSGPPDFTNSPGTQLLSDQPFNVPMEHVANILSSTRHVETGEQISVYMYQLNATVHSIEDGRGLGAFHSVDLPFLFNIKEAWPEDSANAKTSALIGQLWYNFANCGCPDLTWPQYNPAAPFRKVFEADGGSKIEDLSGKPELEIARYKFWAKHY